jgi:hypothetical protein
MEDDILQRLVAAHEEIKQRAMREGTLLTLKQFSSVSGWSPRSVVRAAKAGRVVGVMTGGRWYFARESIGAKIGGRR